MIEVLGREELSCSLQAIDYTLDTVFLLLCLPGTVIAELEELDEERTDLFKVLDKELLQLMDFDVFVIAEVIAEVL